MKDPRGPTLKRGTQVTLHLKEEAYDFLEADTLKSLVEKYSQFINFNIYLWQSKVSLYIDVDTHFFFTVLCCLAFLMSKRYLCSLCFFRQKQLKSRLKRRQRRKMRRLKMLMVRLKKKKRNQKPRKLKRQHGIGKKLIM